MDSFLGLSLIVSIVGVDKWGITALKVSHVRNKCTYREANQLQSCNVPGRSGIELGFRQTGCDCI